VSYAAGSKMALLILAEQVGLGTLMHERPRGAAGLKVEDLDPAEIRGVLAQAINNRYLPEFQDRGPWIQTYSGKAFYLLDPQPSEVEIIDIAHALSHECRFNGHCEEFWSVAQHSLMVMHEVMRLLPVQHRDRRRRISLLALMHDAEEAYYKDIPTPLKLLWPAYGALKDRGRRAINERLGLSSVIEECQDLLPLIKQADLNLLAAEKISLMKPAPETRAIELQMAEPAPGAITVRPASIVRDLFVRAFNNLQRFVELEREAENCKDCSAHRLVSAADACWKHGGPSRK
jgi:5'-deoxynucleotidase YfbR-like HD superfamily hydrolase